MLIICIDNFDINKFGSERQTLWTHVHRGRTGPMRVWREFPTCTVWANSPNTAGLGMKWTIPKWAINLQRGCDKSWQKLVFPLIRNYHESNGSSIHLLRVRHCVSRASVPYRHMQWGRSPAVHMRRCVRSASFSHTLHRNDTNDTLATGLLIMAQSICCLCILCRNTFHAIYLT